MSETEQRPRSRRSRGKIATFFSFKGGVGRSMAVANCAFLAAMNGARVLVMDWDLEAPGLSQYFRGLIDQRGTSEVRRSMGILDLFWGWQCAVQDAKKGDDLERRLAPYRKHDIFKHCVHPLVEKQRLPAKGRLDIITAGSQFIASPQHMTYAEALSHFNWSDFFAKYAGGQLIHQLGEWSRDTYDLILIDSRTGLADVAGICTMQIPDEVYLSFVFNRQNIEGSAQVASSILAARGDDVDIRLVPMRVSKERSTEEADARARTARGFRRAGVSANRIAADLEGLSIPASSGVPYYEMLAPFYASEISAGDLNWAYLRLTRELLGRDLQRLVLDPAWIEDVRKRLQPRISTIDYLRNLETADPDRAFEETDRFLDGALDADPSMELEPDYVRALISATLNAFDGISDNEHEQARNLATKILNLIELMHLHGEEDWRSDFADAMREFDFRLYYPPEENQARLEWLDRILSAGIQTPDIFLQRADLALELAWLAWARDDLQKALTDIEYADVMALDARMTGANEEKIRSIHVRITDFQAQLALREDPNRARDLFFAVLHGMGESSDPQLRTIGANAHLALAELDPERKNEHYSAAADLQPRIIWRDLDLLERIVDSLHDSANAGGLPLARFANALIGQDKRLPIPVSSATHPRTATKFAKIANRLLRSLMTWSITDANTAAAVIVEASIRILAHLSRRRHFYSETDDADRFEVAISAFEALAERLSSMGLNERSLSRLRQALTAMREEDDNA